MRQRSRASAGAPGGREATRAAFRHLAHPRHTVSRVRHGTGRGRDRSAADSGTGSLAAPPRLEPHRQRLGVLLPGDGFVGLPPGSCSYSSFGPAEFLARVIMHIPEPRRHLVRYYGAYSNVSRGKRRRQGEAATGAAPRDGEHATSDQAAGIAALMPALSAEVGRSSSSVFMRWTHWCARRAVGRCGSSRSLLITMSWTRF